MYNIINNNILKTNLKLDIITIVYKNIFIFYVTVL